MECTHVLDLQAEVKRLEDENAALRKKLRDFPSVVFRDAELWMLKLPREGKARDA